MTTQNLAPMWDHIRVLAGIAVRLVEALPADQLDSRPIRGMRTPKEVVMHVFSVMRATAEGVPAGRIENPEHPPLDSVRTRDELVRYANDCFAAADRAVKGVTDAQLAAIVQTPWGISFPGFFAFTVIYDELVHHRGQLFCYVRQLGGDVPMMWDFEHNAEAYRPRATAKA